MYKLLRITTFALSKIIVMFYIRFFKNELGPCKAEVAIVNTKDTGGGAAKIAYGLFLGLKAKHNLSLIVGYKFSKDPSVLEFPRNQIKPWGVKCLQKLARRVGLQDYGALRPAAYINSPHHKKNKIIHLHNLHGGYFSYELLLEISKGKKLIWTVHDFHPITGHCVAPLDCNGYQTGCGNCPHLNIYPSVEYDNTRFLFSRKTKLIEKANPLFVSPSKWLAEKLRKRFPNQRVITIANGVDVELFKPGNKVKARASLNLPPNKKVLLFCSELSTKNPFKGGDVVLDLLKLGLPKDTILLTVGGDDEIVSKNHYNFEYINSEENLAQVYKSTDFLIYPTKADNLPLVILEAMSTGVPAIATPIGGIPEIIEHEKNGWLINQHCNIKEFKICLEHIISLPKKKIQEVQENARTTVINNFSKRAMLKNYSRLYETLNS